MLDYFRFVSAYYTHATSCAQVEYGSKTT